MIAFATARTWRERDSQVETRPGFFLALGGIEVEAPLDLGPFFTIEELEAPPAIFGRELTRLISPRYQLAMVFEEPASMNDSLVGVVWTCVALLRVASGGFFVPCELANRSWDIVDGSSATDLFSTRPIMTEVPTWWPTGTAQVSADDAQWVGDSLVKTLELRADRNFHFALESLSGSFEESDPRMSVAKVWSGIEGLLGIDSELRFRLALYVAVLLEDSGTARLELNRKMRRLYNERSRVVHGSDIADRALVDHIITSQAILAGLLRDAIALGRVRTVAEVESRLLGGAEGAS